MYRIGSNRLRVPVQLFVCFGFVLGRRGNDLDRAEWEEEQKRLDREWYSLDEGYDETHNPFASGLL